MFWNFVKLLVYRENLCDVTNHAHRKGEIISHIFDVYYSIYPIF